MAEDEKPANLRLAGLGNSDEESNSEFNRKIEEFKARTAAAFDDVNEYVARCPQGYILKDTPEDLARIFGPFAIYASCATCGEQQIFWVADDVRRACRPSMTPGEVSQHVVKLTPDDLKRARSHNICLRFKGGR